MILGHFDELKRKLDEIDNKSMIFANDSVKAYNDSIKTINNNSNNNIDNNHNHHHNSYKNHHHNNNSSIDRHNKIHLDRVKKYVCRRDASGATIFHLAYLNKQYKIAQYLVARYPQWAYLPYDYSKLFKEHDKQNNHIEELYRLLGRYD